MIWLWKSFGIFLKSSLCEPCLGVGSAEFDQSNCLEYANCAKVDAIEACCSKTYAKASQCWHGILHPSFI